LLIFRQLSPVGQKKTVTISTQNIIGIFDYAIDLVSLCWPSAAKKLLIRGDCFRVIEADPEISGFAFFYFAC